MCHGDLGSNPERFIFHSFQKFMNLEISWLKGFRFLSITFGWTKLFPALDRGRGHLWAYMIRDNAVASASFPLRLHHCVLPAGDGGNEGNASKVTHSPYFSHPPTARGAGRLTPPISHLSPGLSSTPGLLLVPMFSQTSKIEVSLRGSVLCCLACSPPADHSMRVTVKRAVRFPFFCGNETFFTKQLNLCHPFKTVAIFPLIW